MALLNFLRLMWKTPVMEKPVLVISPEDSLRLLYFRHHLISMLILFNRLRINCIGTNLVDYCKYLY